MTLTEKIIIGIAIIFVFLLIVLLESKEPITKFQRDLMSFEVSEETARNIDLYFRGEREYLTWDETKEIIRVYNLVYVDAGRPEFAGNIDDIINQFNLLITE